MAEFVSEGFARLAAELGPAVVGWAVEDEHELGEGSGIVVQTSTRGVMWYSKAGNVPGFLPFGDPALMAGQHREGV